VSPIRRSIRAHTITNQTISSTQSHHRSLFAGIQLERTTYKLPNAIEHNLIDWNNIPTEEGTTKDLPIFWHVLKSGGTTIKLMYAQCYHLVEACETGELIDANQNQQEQGQQPQLPPILEGKPQEDHPSPWEWMQQQQQQQQVQVDANPDQQRRLETQQKNQLRVVLSEDGRKYVNVDTSTPEGILKASQLGFASSHLADVMFTPLLSESAELLLDANSLGRMFALFRHPVERVISIFYYLQGATWEPTYNPEYAQWTIDDYARSPYCESNWMVRSLTNKMTGPLSGDDILVAKEVLRRKCLVGLMEGMDESITRFHSFFRFGDEDALKCSREQFANKGAGTNSHSHPTLDQTSETWAILAQKNTLDIRLYEYAQELFEEQGKWLKKQKLI